MRLTGVIPERAFIDFRFQGAPSVEQAYEIKAQPDGQGGSFIAHLEAPACTRDFRFQVRANDAESGWQSVEVLPPLS